MIFVTGDTHSDFHRFSTECFQEQKEMTKDDYVVICGDFGGIWYTEDSKYKKQEDYWLDWLNDKPFTTLFVDGNHENYDRLDAFPVEEWNGGLIHRIRPNVIHLMRGCVFNLQGKTFFTFGGASSHDISDGIIPYSENWKEVAKQMEKMRKYMYRVDHVSWWERELPSKEEMERGIKSLKSVDWKVDYVLTHSPAASVVALLGQGLYEQDRLTYYLEDIRCRLDYQKWFAGHFHINKNMNLQDILIYEQILYIPTEKDLQKENEDKER